MNREVRKNIYMEHSRQWRNNDGSSAREWLIRNMERSVLATNNVNYIDEMGMLQTTQIHLRRLVQNPYKTARENQPLHPGLMMMKKSCIQNSVRLIQCEQTSY